jgi:hypothetical protein
MADALTPATPIASGWTFSPYHGAVYHFAHIAKRKAERLAQQSQQPHVVETINWTFANGDSQTVHFNQYFALTLSLAIALAAQIAVNVAVAEDVVRIRPATAAEIELMWLASDRYQVEPPAIADDTLAQIKALG